MVQSDEKLKRRIALDKQQSNPECITERDKRTTAMTGLPNGIVSGGFTESFLSVLEELETEKAKGKRKLRKEDELGERIADVLNQNKLFGPIPTQENHGSQEDEEDDPLRPLLSKRNFQRLQRQWRRFQHFCMNEPYEKVKESIQEFWKYTASNSKSPLSGLLAFMLCILPSLVSVAATTTFLCLSALKFAVIIAWLLISMIIDVREVTNALPTGLRNFVAGVFSFVVWFDKKVLFGKRYSGREWNRDDFEWTDGKKAKSSGQYLWKLPPPSINEGKKRCVDEDHMSRDEWGNDTLKHVVAIDFCYIMLREEYHRKQYSKLKRGYTRIHSLEMSTEDSREDSASEWTRNDPLDSPSQRKTRSLPNSPQSKTEDSKLPCDERRNPSETDTPGHLSEYKVERMNSMFFDKADSFRVLNHILEDDFSDAPSSPCLSRNGSLGASSDISATDMKWSDVGAQIGLKILGSAAVQKAMTSQDTKDNITTIKKKVEKSLAAKKYRHSKSHSYELPAIGELKATKASGGKSKKPLILPVHSMWTSASAAAAKAPFVQPSRSEDSESSLENPVSLEIQIVAKTETTPVENSDPFVEQASHSHTKLLEERESSILSSTTDENDIFCSPVKSLACTIASPQNGTCSTPLRKPSPRNIEAIEIVREKKKLVQSPSTKNFSKRPLLLSGVKIVVPIFPIQPGTKPSKRVRDSNFQMATVVSSKRLAIFAKNKMPPAGNRGTNCLSVKVKLDKSFLRNGEFAEMTFRIMDEWPDQFMPKHSKLPLGTCVSTSFGLGVLVGWRVEDDCHIVRSLWQRRGPGSACAYLQRDAIHSTMEASVGFEVSTSLGKGEVVAYVDGGEKFKSGRYCVKIAERGRHEGHVLELNRSDVLSCRSAQFIPVIEHVREAAQYQLQVDNYRKSLLEHENDVQRDQTEGKIWRTASKYIDTLWKSFLKAIEEDDGFDKGMNEFIASMVAFFNRLDEPNGMIDSKGNELDTNVVITSTESSNSGKQPPQPEKVETGFWFVNDVFGIFGNGENVLEPDDPNAVNESIEVECNLLENGESKNMNKSYERAFAVIRKLMRTVSIARASCHDEPEFKLGLSISYEFLLFVKTVIKVQRKNVSPHTLKVWRRAWEEIASTFGPVKDRLERIGQGIAERMEQQGRKAKVRLLRFADIVVQDDVLLMSLEQGDWDRCIEQVELALVRARIIEQASREHYRKTFQFVYNQFATASTNKGAAARNNEKLAQLAIAVQCIAAPRKSILQLFLDDKVLDVMERILVRVFCKEDVASRMLQIHASNFHSLRQLRMLKDFTVAGRLWMPLLDAANAEFALNVSSMPDNAKEYLGPISSLFSLCVARFHKISEGDLTKDWLDFLLEEEAVSIIHEIDMKLILALESFSRDVREMMVVLPYYPSIEDDILKLVDEVDIQHFLKEASEAMEDVDKLSEFIREKATIAIERFLDYLPKMSIPVEKRDLADGWVLTCHGSDGGDLTLTDFIIKRENLTCQVLGGDTLFFPMLGGDDGELHLTESGSQDEIPDTLLVPSAESSVLDHIREMLIQAQKYGCWQVGIGGIEGPPSDKYVASVLHGLPVSAVLNCAIELWRHLEIDDDELLEVAIRDVSYQIELQEERGENWEEEKAPAIEPTPSQSSRPPPHQIKLPKHTESSASLRNRFNPRVDPTVLYFEISKLTFHLDNFLFRIEKHEDQRTVFDPVFEGCGNLMVKNVSIKLRVECARTTVQRAGREMLVPILQLRELDVTLEKVRLKVKDTGADWILNRVVQQFEESITTIVGTNLNDQVREQVILALQNLNSYFEVNPELMLDLLGISMDDLEDKVVWV